MIIGLLGLAGSGKDTCADFLVREHNFVRYAFGDKVKEVARIMFDFNDEQLYGNLKNEIDTRWNITPRECFQIIGTDFGQFYLHEKLPNINLSNRELWAKHFEIWYKKEQEKNKDIKVVVSDVRFKHEINSIKKLGGKIINIVRPSINTSKDVYNHLSEQEQQNIKTSDSIIYNHSTKYQLYFDLMKNI